MKKYFAFVLLTLTFNSVKAQVVPNVDWISYYQSTISSTLLNMANALDANNNVYLTGVYENGTNKDLLVLKYDSLGVFQWAYAYDNGNDDVGTSIVLDPTGYNVFVTGASYDGTSLNDFITIRLSASTGGTVWTARKDYGMLLNDKANDIRLDNNGDVYVTGTGTGTDKDIFIVKYNGTNGSLLWSSSFDSSFGTDQGTSAIYSSLNGSLYVVGTKATQSNGSDIITLGINPANGAQNWTVGVNGTSNSSDEGVAVALSGTNVVVTGVVTNSGTGQDYRTCMYNSSNGNQIWSGNYDYSNNNNSATSLVVDSAGNVVVTGYVYNGSTYSYHSVLYNTSGTQVWVNIENSGLSSLLSLPKAKTDTIANHFYICAPKQGPFSNEDVFAYQISPGGNTTWKKNR